MDVRRSVPGCATRQPASSTALASSERLAAKSLRTAEDRILKIGRSRCVGGHFQPLPIRLLLMEYRHPHGVRPQLAAENINIELEALLGYLGWRIPVRNDDTAERIRRHKRHERHGV